MIALNIAETGSETFPDAWSSTSRRHYRSRNHLTIEAVDWNTGMSIPADPPHWDDMFGGSIRVGVMAAKRTFKPALAVWFTMAAIAAVYYLIPMSHGLFAWLLTIQKAMGVLFPSLGMGLSVGILVEVVKVLSSEKRRWTRENSITALFNFGVFGLMGVTHHYRYAFQNEVFGAGNSFQVLASKVAFDQFIWTVIVANPYQAICYLWKNNSFSWKAVHRHLFPFRSFWGTQMLPVLITNWAFWIPMAFIIYYFPPGLQLPLSILAVTTWVMLLSVLTSMNRREES